jgi:hypothetical protein
LFQASQSDPAKIIAVLLTSIRWVLRCPTGSKLAERSAETFTAVVQQALRMIFEATMKQNSFMFNFPRPGERINAACMSDDLGETLRSAGAEAEIKDPVCHELDGSWVDQCVVPRTRVSFKGSSENCPHHEAHPANVILYVGGY